MNMKQAGPRVSSLLVLFPVAALLLCAFPSFAQDEDSDAAPAQQGGHYEARPDGDEDDEVQEAPAPVPQRPAARKRTVPRVFRARPGGIYAEPNQVAAPEVEDGVILGGAGVSQGAADKKIGQGTGSASGSGGGGGGAAGEGTKASGGSNGGAGSGACDTPPPAGSKVTIVDTGDASAYWPQRTFKTRPSDIIAFKMTVPAGFVGSGVVNAYATASGQRAPAAVLSTSPGCADKLGSQSACFSSGLDSASVKWSADPAVRGYKYYCHLTPGKVYYVNVFSQFRIGAYSYNCADLGDCTFYAARSAPWGANGGPLPAGGAVNGGWKGNAPPPSTTKPPRAPVPGGCQWSYKGFSPAPPAPSFACAQGNAGQVVATGTDEYICTCR